MRIAQVCPYSLSEPGGVQGQVLGLAREFRRQGHYCQVIAPCQPGRLISDPNFVSLGGAVGVRSNGSVAPIGLSGRSVLRTVGALWKGNFDVVHIHEPLVPLAALSATLASRAPVVATFHRHGGDMSALAPLARLVLRRVARRVAVSDMAAETAHQLAPARYEVLFNGIDPTRWNQSSFRPVDRPIVLFVGRDEPRKGLDVLLESFAQLDGAELWVAGCPPRESRPNVRWLGRLTEEALAEAFGQASVLCAPSLAGESFGVVLLEAMAAGLVVVASDLPAYRMALGPDLTAYLVAPGDCGQLAAALAGALTDGAAADCLWRVLGPARAAEFSFAELARRYLRIFEEVIACEAW